MDNIPEKEGQGRAPGLYDEQLQRKRQEKRIDPAKRDDEKKAAEAEEKS